MLPQSQSASNLPGIGDFDAPRSAAIYSSTPEISQRKSGSPHRSRLHDYERSPSTGARSSSSAALYDHHEDPRQVILRSFAPRIAVYASPDAEIFIKSKGFYGGFKGLLRPFGERIQGKVVVRDSVGASRGWEDFSIRFIEYGNVQHSERSPSNATNTSVGGDTQLNGSPHGSEQLIADYDYQLARPIDMVIEHQLKSEDDQTFNKSNDHLESEDISRRFPGAPSSAYLIYLRKLLSSMPFVPYETFSHPVACVVAVSSHSPEPIEVLRQLYANTSRGGNGTPPWVGSDYLRYYVLIHDEENDDITKSTALFDLMKRHFGLNCHLLRLRSSECIQTDDDSIRVPPCEWLSAEEELAEIRNRGMFMSRQH